jgi:hypothetical protein
MKRSEIRGNGHRFDLAPGFRYAPPGLQKRKRFGGETPTDAIGIQPRLTGPAAPGSPGAHLSAFHRGSGLGDRTPPPSFSSALPVMRPPSGFPLSLPVSVQRCFSRTGRNADRADFPKLPGNGLQVRARVPHSPRAYGLPAAARPIARGSKYMQLKQGRLSM